MVALLAGFAIFPLVFAHQLAPNSGAGLVFQTLPIAFGELPGGQIFGSIFFLLLIAAAITSCIGNFAPVVAWTEEKFSISHAKAARLAGFVMWLLGLGTVFSFNVLSDFYPLSFIDRLDGKTIYDTLDYVMANVLLPVGAFLTAVFIGWFATKDAIREEMGLPEGMAFTIWRLLIRFVVPAAVAVIFAVSMAG